MARGLWDVPHVDRLFDEPNTLGCTGNLYSAFLCKQRDVADLNIVVWCRPFTWWAYICWIPVSTQLKLSGRSWESPCGFASPWAFIVVSMTFKTEGMDQTCWTKCHFPLIGNCHIQMGQIGDWSILNWINVAEHSMRSCPSIACRV